MCLGQATVHIRLPTCLVANKLMSSEAPAWPSLGLEPLSCNLGMFISALIETGRQRLGDSFTEWKVCRVHVESLGPASSMDRDCLSSYYPRKVLGVVPLHGSSM